MPILAFPYHDEPHSDCSTGEEMHNLPEQPQQPIVHPLEEACHDASIKERYMRPIFVSFSQGGCCLEDGRGYCVG